MDLVSPAELRCDLHSFSHAETANRKPPSVISVLASLIDRTIARNQRRPVKNQLRWAFDGDEAPDMTVASYMERIFRYTGAGPSVFVVAYVYIDRFCQLHPDFRIGPTNVHRLLITTVMAASKYVEDLNYRNSYFARVGGFSLQELNKLETELLFLMKFKMHVNLSVYVSYCSHLEREVSTGGGYQIERTLRCAQEIKAGNGSRHRRRRCAMPVTRNQFSVE